MQFQLNAVHKISISMNVIKSFILFIAFVLEIDALRDARAKSFAAGFVNSLAISSINKHFYFK